MAEPLVRRPQQRARRLWRRANHIFISNDFGLTWPVTPNMTLAGWQRQHLLADLANDARLFVGSTNGRVFRADLSGATWSLTRLDNAAGGALPLTGLISDIAIDWSDPARNSIYICFGGTGDARHVWHFNGTTWQARSGSGMNS